MRALSPSITKTDERLDQRQAGEPTSKNELTRNFFYLAGTPKRIESTGLEVARIYDLSEQRIPIRRLEIVTYAIAAGQEIRPVEGSISEFSFSSEAQKIAQRRPTQHDSAVEESFNSSVDGIPSVELSVKGGMQVKGYDLVSVSDEQKTRVLTAAEEAGWDIQFDKLKMLVVQRREKPRATNAPA